MTRLTPEQERLCAESPYDFSDLRAVFVNCTLKRSPEVSHTQGLADQSIAIMERNGVQVETIRAVDHDIATGVYDDMTEHGWERDEWPAIYRKVMDANILVLLSPIWLGEKSSVCTQVIERLYANSHLLNDQGQWAYYGRVGGCIITGNEDGAKHCAMNILYSLQHLGFDPAAGRRRLARGGGTRPQLPRRGLGRPVERVHEPQHDVPDLEPHAPRADAEGRGWDPSAREPARGMGCGLPLRLSEPRLPLTLRSARRRRMRIKARISGAPSPEQSSTRARIGAA
jgi:multimeric flavodoxin WrbA